MFKPLTTINQFEQGLKSLLILNIIDAFFTAYWWHLEETGALVGTFTELNPVMAGALTLGPAVFILAKVMLVILACGLLWRNKTQLTARYAFLPLAFIYSLTVGAHIGTAIRLFL